MTAYFLTLPAADDVLLFAIIFIASAMTIYIGKYRFNTVRDNLKHVPSFVTVAAMGLSGLLTGLIMCISVSGYHLREQAQIKEAKAIDESFLYLGLLPSDLQSQVMPLLKGYTSDRVHFFREDSLSAQRGWLTLAEKKQWLLWQALTSVQLRQSGPVMASIFHVYSELSESRIQTSAVWRRQIPDAIWLIVIIAMMAACFLVGHQIPEQQGSHLFLIILPALASLILFIIAEIDIPGQGIIRITPDEMERLEASLVTRTENEVHDLSRSVHHVS